MNMITKKNATNLVIFRFCYEVDHNLYSDYLMGLQFITGGVTGKSA